MARNIIKPEATKTVTNQEEITMPTLGHNNPPSAINEEGAKIVEQNETINASTPSDGVLTKLEQAQQEVIAASKELVSYARKGETILSKLAYAASHWVTATIESEKMEPSNWHQGTIGGLQTKLRMFIRDSVKVDDERLGHATKNDTVEAYIGDALRLGAMHALGKHGITYHEKGFFTVPSNILFTHVYGPDPENPAKTKLVPNTSSDPTKIHRADIATLFRGRPTKGAKGEGEFQNPAFPPAPKDPTKVDNKKGRPARQAGKVSAERAETHTAERAPMEIEFAKPDGKAAIKVTIKPDSTTSETEQAATRDALKLPVVSLATALATLLGSRVATKTLGELGERTRNALNELAQRLDQAEDEYSRMDVENEKNGNKLKKAS